MLNGNRYIKNSLVRYVITPTPNTQKKWLYYILDFIRGMLTVSLI